MCIRDRAFALHFDDAHQRRFGAERRQEIELLHERRCQADACLLYTSDAADDLLCVDHGGSRISKKKKNKNT